MKRPRLLHLLVLLGEVLFCASLFACEPVPANTVISCKVDMDCPNMLRCSGNICRRKALMGSGGGAAGAAGMGKAAGNVGGASAKPAGSVAGTTAMMASGQSSGGPPPASGSSGSGASESMSAGAVAGMTAPAIVVMCPADACMPGGTCMQEATDYSCVCSLGYLPSEGRKRCLPINHCPARACIPGGKCVDSMGDFTCMCDPGYEGTGTKDCKPSAGGVPAAAGGACPTDACAPGGQCVPAMGDYSCKCSVELRMPDAKSCPLIDQQDGTVLDVKRNLTWQKAIASTPKGTLSPLDDASTAMRYCSAVKQPAATWRAPTADELRSLPALASDRHACFGTTTGVICNDIPPDSGQITPANMMDMRCVH
jgi:hypothetical protein